MRKPIPVSLTLSLANETSLGLVTTSGPERGLAAVPAYVVGFLVRYWTPGSRGQGVLQYNDEGTPLVVGGRLGPSGLARRFGHRPGRYRLMPIGIDSQRLPKAPDVIVRIVAPEESTAPSAPTRPRALVTALVPSTTAIGRNPAALLN